jgi:hypothetical protein
LQTRILALIDGIGQQHRTVAVQFSDQDKTYSQDEGSMSSTAGVLEPQFDEPVG